MSMLILSISSNTKTKNKHLSLIDMVMFILFENQFITYQCFLKG